MSIFLYVCVCVYIYIYIYSVCVCVYIIGHKNKIYADLSSNPGQSCLHNPNSFKKDTHPTILFPVICER